MSNSDEPKHLLIAGAEILSAVLKPHGYEFKLEKEGKGSGGHFATGSFRKHDRVLELHFRFSLGLVTYHIDDSSSSTKHTCDCWECTVKIDIPIFPRNRWIRSTTLQRTLKSTARISFRAVPEVSFFGGRVPEFCDVQGHS